MLKIWRFIFIFLLVAALLAFIAAFSLVDNRLHLVFCDVGQGDAILVYKGSTQILVDGGPDSQVLNCLSRHMPFWDRKIEAVVLSHPDADHYLGLIDVVRRYQIKSFLTSGVEKEGKALEVLKSELEKAGVERLGIVAGNGLRLGEVKMRAYWPTREWVASKANNQAGGIVKTVLGAKTASNDLSLVLGLSYGNFDVLLTGDIEPPVTNIVTERLRSSASTSPVGVPKVLSESKILSGTEGVEVLKVPHHGSKNGLTEELLEATKPKLAVISVGEKNSYGHPSKEAIELLTRLPARLAAERARQGDKAIKLLRTDQDGEVEIVTDGKTWQTLY